MEAYCEKCKHSKTESSARLACELPCHGCSLDVIHCVYNGYVVKRDKDMQAHCEKCTEFESKEVFL